MDRLRAVRTRMARSRCQIGAVERESVERESVEREGVGWGLDPYRALRLFAPRRPPDRGSSLGLRRGLSWLRRGLPRSCWRRRCGTRRRRRTRLTLAAHHSEVALLADGAALRGHWCYLSFRSGAAGLLLSRVGGEGGGGAGGGGLLGACPRPGTIPLLICSRGSRGSRLMSCPPQQMVPLSHRGFGANGPRRRQSSPPASQGSRR